VLCSSSDIAISVHCTDRTEYDRTERFGHPSGFLANLLIST
jgi:hypothetical protein